MHPPPPLPSPTPPDPTTPGLVEDGVSSEPGTVATLPTSRRELIHRRSRRGFSAKFYKNSIRLPTMYSNQCMVIFTPRTHHRFPPYGLEHSGKISSWSVCATVGHVVGWEPCSLHNLGRVSWVGSVLLDRSCTTAHNDRLGSNRSSVRRVISFNIERTLVPLFTKSPADLRPGKCQNAVGGASRRRSP